jgi:hypothetical protein
MSGSLLATLEMQATTVAAFLAAPRVECDQDVGRRTQIERVADLERGRLSAPSLLGQIATDAESPKSSRFDEIGSFFSDHQHGGVSVARYDGWYERKRRYLVVHRRCEPWARDL